MKPEISSSIEKNILDIMEIITQIQNEIELIELAQNLQNY